MTSSTASFVSHSCDGIPLSDTKPSARSVLSFRHLSYQVSQKGGKSRALVDDVSVDVKSGELLAIMGPSGAGKSTLLDLMAFRKTSTSEAVVCLNGHQLDKERMYQLSAFVEQEDALLGVLTVRETVTYALRLHSPMLSRKEVNARVLRVLRALGLLSCMNQRIGTPISRGISGGQKRRVTAACAMVTFPRILFLDEVTSGLDSTSAREVVSAIRSLAVTEGIIVIATIHQPSLETLSQFTDLIFLARGQVCYSGTVNGLESFFEKWGKPVKKFSTPSEHAMNFLNDDFASSTSSVDVGSSMVAAFRRHYLSTVAPNDLNDPSSSYSVGKGKPHISSGLEGEDGREIGKAGVVRTLFWNTLVLCERSAVNYARNLLAYGVRAGMYAGMGLMLATIWIRLGTEDSTINDRLSVHFYSAAFLSFMSVAGIPSFLEERSVFYREKKNGLYSTLPFVLSNTLVNIPFLFACVVVFLVICYWAIGLHPGAPAFFRYLAFLYLTILAAESQVLIVGAVIPIFVAALAIASFLNGFWMSVGGYFIKARSLPRFWYYSFHFMDYQRYAFDLLSNSDLRGMTFKCSNGCECAYPSSTASLCTVSGDDVLRYLEIRDITYGKWIGIMVGINLVYRILLYIALRLRTK
ncbi:P-loop containing nucleoside triphosphate hydrolase protein [Marasmius fiardii PR-910]|nr:P-loop containing nucleoside triphosphate hydrolase protein [Marasmius fiardii PR-910]